MAEDKAEKEREWVSYKPLAPSRPHFVPLSPARGEARNPMEPSNPLPAFRERTVQTELVMPGARSLSERPSRPSPNPEPESFVRDRPCRKDWQGPSVFLPAAGPRRVTQCILPRTARSPAESRTRRKCACLEGSRCRKSTREASARGSILCILPNSEPGPRSVHRTPSLHSGCCRQLSR